MRRLFACVLAVVLVTSSGCSFEVQKDTFNIPSEMVGSIELQKEYKNDKDESYFLSKVVDERADIEEICEMIKSLPVARASSEEPNPIRTINLIVIIKGEKEHRLIVNQDLVFYDKVAYNYKNADTFDSLMNLYDRLEYTENETEAKPF